MWIIGKFGGRPIGPHKYEEEESCMIKICRKRLLLACHILFSMWILAGLLVGLSIVGGTTDSVVVVSTNATTRGVGSIISSPLSLNSHLRGGNSGAAGRKLQTPVTESFQVIDDTFVRDNNPNGNYNGVTNLGVAYGLTSNERITYVKFPLIFDVRNSLSITNANISMRVNQVPTTSLTIDLFPCDTETWSESVITWSNRPTYDNSTGALITSYTVTPSDLGTWVDFDVTNALIGAVQALKESMSIVIQANVPIDLNPPSEIMKFDSKEDLVNIPYLEVTYTPSSGTSPPTASPSSPPTIDYGQPSYPQLVSLSPDGSTLNYVPYANEINVVQGSTANSAAVNTVPDFSSVGYKGGGVPIPFIPVVQTVSAIVSASVRRASQPFLHFLTPVDH